MHTLHFIYEYACELQNCALAFNNFRTGRLCCGFTFDVSVRLNSFQIWIIEFECHWVQALYGRLDGVFVPDMYEDLTTQRVLIMEWVEGRRLRSGTSGS
jgi:hypothetical protein